MDELISRRSLLKAIENCKAYIGFPMATKILALELTTYEPTVDAVSVVRCKDCTKGHPELSLKGCVWCARHDRDLNYDDFCSYGERRSV